MKKNEAPKTRNCGTWTEARFKGFIVSNLRLASRKWGPKDECIKKAFVRNGVNPATGRKCKLHKCAACGGLFPKSGVRADHIEPVIDPSIGFVSWDSFIERMFVEADGFQPLCDKCHDGKTAEEREVRTMTRRRAAGNAAVRVRSRRVSEKQGQKKRMRKV